MEYQSNFELILASQNNYKFTDEENSYMLTITDQSDECLCLTLTAERNLETFKAILKESDLSQYSLFTSETVDYCLKNKSAVLRHQQTNYLIIFYHSFIGSYKTAEILFEKEIKSFEDVISNLLKENQSKNEEINALKETIGILSESVAHLKGENVSIKNRLEQITSITNGLYVDTGNLKTELAQLKEESTNNIVSKPKTSKKSNKKDQFKEINYSNTFSYSDTNISKILKDNEYQFLRNRIGQFGLKLLYSSDIYGDRAATFHELCDEKFPTLTVIKSSEGRSSEAIRTYLGTIKEVSLKVKDCHFFFL
jgi:hypothetical protein